jgi:chromate transporter
VHYALILSANWKLVMTNATALPPQVSYAELARFFLRFSLTAFGGPVAHIAMGEDEIVTRRKWLTRDHYLDLVAATNLIPGPNSTEVMIHVGYVLRGIPGAIVTGVCFILPAFLITLVLAVLYVSTGTIPQVESILWGIKPVIVAIIANVGYRLVGAALKNSALWLLFIVCIAAMVLLEIPEVIVMLAAGLVYAVYQTRGRIFAQGTQSIAPLLLTHPLLQTLQAAPASLFDIFFYFLKIGSVLFGSGYVLFAYIQQDVVDGFGWLNAQQLLDAIAIGQFTPGPVSTTTAVIGYIIAGLPGAIAATVGIFLPSFVLVILTAPLIPKMRRSEFLSAFLSGVNAGVIAAILLTLVDLASASIRTLDGTALSPVAIALALGALALLVRTKMNATWLILAGGIVGFIVGVSR